MLVINKPKFRESDPQTMKFLISGSIVTQDSNENSFDEDEEYGIYFFFYG